ncbi:DNA binding methylated-DNA--cysteine S-methyltransferase [Aspergillus sclerotiicarbonarius CBS 121057]|uniref:Methylated-DNA--protein-cysteine methyltransferase n=1 Tax=Aspergillus sclerotiicarbonarius (strain CBS 121057 / IBT 28362) TaxID=1448318 RepID=A0A319EH91_ASPSB|nr:DNA binding methylated-DNA--cysteine S-methyltransferase [Aspergillus sclerotiicarbonarius CBS 121057]
MSSTQPQTTATASPNQTRITKKIATHPTLPLHRRKIYLALLSVPPGRWTTYAALAKHLGTSPRAIGAAMRLNPFAPQVPCHRVLGGGGKLLVGYSGGDSGAKNAKAGVGMKRRMLEEEGVEFTGEGVAQGACFEGFGVV